MLTLNLTKTVFITWNENFIKIVGPLGFIVKRKGNFSLAIKESKLYLWSQENPFKENAYFSWLNSLIIGVTKGYKQKLKLVGVGFKAFLEENNLILKIGYSHEVKYSIPKDVNIKISKGKGILILLKGSELQRVRQVAAEIRSLRIPDSYKGKGIHYYNENIILKKGKREGK